MSLNCVLNQLVCGVDGYKVNHTREVGMRAVALHYWAVEQVSLSELFLFNQIT
jgi:hypothetical protein